MIIPYRIKVMLDTFKFKLFLAAANKLVPITCMDLAADSHLYVCLNKKDWLPAILSTYSFCKATKNQTAINFILDKNVTLFQQSELERLFKNSTILKKSSLPNDFIKKNPLQIKFLEGNFTLAKFIFPNLFSHGKKIIILDADCVFFQDSQLISDWIKDNSEDFYYIHGIPNPSASVIKKINNFFKGFSNWKIDNYFFNSGLLLYIANQEYLSLAENFMEYRNEVRNNLIDPEIDIWTGEWTVEQSIYLSIFGNYNKTKALPYVDYGIGGSGKIFSHFLTAYYCRYHNLVRLRKRLFSLLNETKVT